MSDAQPASGAGLWFLNSHVTIVLSKDANADGISVLDHRLPPGDAPPLHVHHGEDEIFHIIAGEIRYRIGERTQIVRAGDTVLAPRDVPHAYRVLSPEGARYLTITRGGFEAMVRSASRPAPSVTLPEPVEPSPELQAKLAALCAVQNIELLGPPLD